VGAAVGCVFCRQVSAVERGITGLVWRRASRVAGWRGTGGGRGSGCRADRRSQPGRVPFFPDSFRAIRPDHRRAGRHRPAGLGSRRGRARRLPGGLPGRRCEWAVRMRPDRLALRRPLTAARPGSRAGRRPGPSLRADLVLSRHGRRVRLLPHPRCPARLRQLWCRFGFAAHE
jgi:hypothetical protein